MASDAAGSAADCVMVVSFRAGLASWGHSGLEGAISGVISLCAHAERIDWTLVLLHTDTNV
jgi:hypothetical protein